MALKFNVGLNENLAGHEHCLLDQAYEKPVKSDMVYGAAFLLLTRSYTDADISCGLPNSSTIS